MGGMASIFLYCSSFLFIRSHSSIQFITANPSIFFDPRNSHPSLNSRTLSSSPRPRVHSLRRDSSSNQTPSRNRSHSLRDFMLLIALSFILLFLRLCSDVLLPNFPQNWRNLVAFSEEAETKSMVYPMHIWKAVVAYEDRRFFRHFGIDPFGIARAVLSFSARGGGSTITQQLVKNTFLKNERKLSRKFVEMILAIALERTLSKERILCSYVHKIYWGHGKYGLESASTFYFGKHPSLLRLAESAMLAGIIPSPEIRSPFRHSTGGKTFQIRVLKRMVAVGFLDTESALIIAKQPLQLNDGAEHEDESLGMWSECMKGPRKLESPKKASVPSSLQHIWNWEKESKRWEAYEDMVNWAVKVQTSELSRKKQKYCQLVINQGSGRELDDNQHTIKGFFSSS